MASVWEGYGGPGSGCGVSPPGNGKLLNVSNKYLPSICGHRNQCKQSSRSHGGGGPEDIGGQQRSKVEVRGHPPWSPRGQRGPEGNLSLQSRRERWLSTW